MDILEYVGANVMQLLIALGVGLIVVATIIGIWRKKPDPLDLPPAAAAVAASVTGRKIATIEEHVKMTGWGGFWAIMLALNCLFSLAASSAATTIFQQLAAGVSFIGGTILCGLGVVLGRKRTYAVYRSEPE